MKTRLIWLGLAAFMLALVVVLPARWLAGLLPPELHCAAWRGSVWNGQCSGLTVLQAPEPPLQVEQVNWKLQPSALLRFILQADFDVHTLQGTSSGQIELGRNGHVALQDVTVTAQFDRRLATLVPAGWIGQLQAQHLTIRLQGKQLQALSGEVELRDFNDGRGGALGSYRLLFPPSTPPPFIGALQDIDGPLEVKASLTISADRRWVLDGTVAARPGAAPTLQRQLDILGAPDANGRRRLGAEGSFK
jgi:hypothetical protein